MKLDTRIVVLEYALYTEKNVDNLLRSYLNIDIAKRKALTNKSGGLAYKNKIDLLYDMEILDDTEYSSLLLLMEYRNQFMHNYDCNTYSDATSLLGEDKKKRLLSYLNPKITGEPTEEDLRCAYCNLFEIVNLIVQKKTVNRRKILDENKEFIEDSYQTIIALLNKYFDLVDFIYQIEEDYKTEDLNVMRFQIYFLSHVQTQYQKDLKSDAFTKHQTTESTDKKDKILDRLLRSTK